MSIVPRYLPQQPRIQTQEILKAHGVTDRCAILGVRGYYLDSMGVPKKNDRAIYDDAVIVITPTNYNTFNFNTDPSAYRQGIATLKPGVWRYKIGIHGLSKPKAQQYRALVQAGEVVVTRDGKGEDRGFFGINIHRGGVNGTSSLGCQTLPPAQWDSFLAAVEEALEECGQKDIAYCLIENGLNQTSGRK